MTGQTFAESAKCILRESIEDVIANKEKYIRNPGKDFQRDRKLPLGTMIDQLLQMGSGSLQNELLKYHGFSEKTPTKSAFCQQRSKLLPSAMEHLFHSFTCALYTLDTPKTTEEGYSILACDGSDINIPYNPDDFETYHRNCQKRGYNQLHLNTVFDILNRTYIDAVLEPDCKSHERAAFIQMVDRYSGNKAIFIADRGYEGYNVFAHLMRSGQKFVVRLKDDSSNGIISSYDFEKFRDKNREFDCIIRTILTCKQTKEVKKDIDTYTIINRKQLDYFEKNAEFPLSLRIVCIRVDEGVYEYLATNLDRNQFPLPRLKDLYHLRWGIETSFRDLKYTIDILHFHARTRAYVEQEAWARLLVFNFCQAITCHVIAEKKEPAKFDVKINFAIAVCICREFLKQHSDDEINICRLLARFLIPIRPNRASPRNMKPQSAKSFLYRVA